MQKDDLSVVNVLNLWSWPEENGAESFYNLMIQIVDDLGIEVNRGHIKIRGENIKTLKANTVKKRLAGGLSGLQNLSLEKVKNVNHPKGVWFEYPDFEVEVNCSKNLGNLFSVFFECKYSANSEEILSNIAKNVCEMVNPKYGYVTQIPQWYNPKFFISGIGEGERGERFRPILELLKTDWHQDLFDRFHVRTKIRDVYEVNYLNACHLKRIFPVGRKTIDLQEFIHENEYGELKRLNDLIWIWKPPIEKISIIRSELMKAGFLIVTV